MKITFDNSRADYKITPSILVTQKLHEAVYEYASPEAIVCSALTSGGKIVGIRDGKLVVRRELEEGSLVKVFDFSDNSVVQTMYPYGFKETAD